MLQFNTQPAQGRRPVPASFSFDRLERIRAVLQEALGLIILVASIASYVYLLDWIAGVAARF